MSTPARVEFRPTGVPFAGFLAHAMALGPERFAATYAHPFLVGLEIPAGDADDSGGDTYSESMDAMTDAADRPARLGASSRVFALRHRRQGEAGGLTVGRGRDNDCVVADPKVSKVHVVLRVEGGSVSVTDPGSHNGTFVDGERILTVTPTPLRSGCRLQLGARAFLFLSARRFLQDIARFLPPDAAPGARRR